MLTCKGITSIIVSVSVLALVAGTPASALDCEANLIAAQRAADMAASSTKDLHSAAWAGGSGLACAAVSASVGFTDVGLLSLACALLGAKLSQMTAPDAAGASAKEAFLRVRDTRCREREAATTLPASNLKARKHHNRHAETKVASGY